MVRSDEDAIARTSLAQRYRKMAGVLNHDLECAYMGAIPISAAERTLAFVAHDALFSLCGSLDGDLPRLGKATPPIRDAE